MVKHKKKKKTALRSIRLFFTEWFAEFKKIKWPTPKELLVKTLAVLTISVIISAYLISLDIIFYWLRQFILF